MTTFVVLWLAGSVIAFLALRKLALRDFGVVTVGGLVGLIFLSIVTPCGLLVAFALGLEGGGIMSKPVWRK